MIRLDAPGALVSVLTVLLGVSIAGCGSDSEPERNHVEQTDRTAEPAGGPVGSGPGAELYISYCAACHSEDGSGIGSIYPPLAGSEFLQDREQTIGAILNGLQGPITVGEKEYNGTMPPLPPIYDNEQAAAVINYVVERFGGGSWQTTAEEVAAIRE